MTKVAALPVFLVTTFLCLGWLPLPALAKENSGVHFLSPVYEEMLANEAALLKRRLAEQKVLKEDEPGVIFVDAEPLAELREAAVDFSQPEHLGFMLVFMGTVPTGDRSRDLSSRRTAVRAVLEEQGLHIHEELAPAELEFIEDESGRQAINLDDPQYQNQIYERLVREGMNPVHAWPETQELIRRFRSLQNKSILIVGKSRTT